MSQNDKYPEDGAADESSAGSPIQYFAAQAKVYPRAVSGFLRQFKWAVLIICLGIYYLSPFLRWARPGDLPDQAILIDLPGRRAYFFMFEIWPQEVYIIAGILIFAAVTLFFVTSLLGRVWCGFFCFQTVWTDLYMWVERVIQGDRNARMKLDKSPLGWEKIWKKCLTHLSWLFIGVITAGAFVLYFNDAPSLIRDIFHGEVSRTVLAFIIGLTLSTYIMAGFAREQVCTYMCPYARFQSAMFDVDTLIIGYDAQRGEPRGSHKQGDSWEGRGHCIDCNQCVAVCPTGIDIREGLQMACIACGLCVDACNGVMDKVGLPRGLIRYDTERNQNARVEAQSRGAVFKDRLRILRPRTFYYASLLLLVGGLMLAGLMTRAPFELHALHDRNPLFVRLSAGDVRNSYTVKILNKTHEDRDFTLTLEGLPQAKLRIEGAGKPDAAHVKVLADSVGQFRVLVTLPPDSPPVARHDIVFRLVDNATGRSESVASMFVTGL